MSFPPDPEDVQRRCWTISAGPDGLVTGQCWLYNGHPGLHQWTTQPEVDGLAALPVSPSLDVKRLARAMVRANIGYIDPYPKGRTDHDAQRIAAEYARLSETP